ncbi:MAG: DegT/DnrJ/EryC1/StrS family aminotransferase [Pirellulaceae bacterium]|nr:DegT/DnrJ/EryC1/StrS family aminotransferase [Pirellulaceae bacterium]
MIDAHAAQDAREQPMTEQKLTVLPTDNKEQAAFSHQEVQNVPFLDIKRDNSPLLEEIQQAVTDVCASGIYVLGPECQKLEKTFKEICHVDHAIACSSGSDALLLALMAIEIGPGDEVILPSFTFFATASAVWRLGATPVFADIDPVSYNIDPAAVERAITPKTKAIIPVHLFGQCADMDPLNQLAHEHKLYIIEDAAQAVGAKYKNRPAGSMGHMSAFSFYPTKNLGGFGDGGLLTSTDSQLADRLALLRVHGMRPRYYHKVVGINSRLDAMQAAVLNVKARYLDQWTAARQKHASRYHELLSMTALSQIISLPETTDGCKHVWNQFTLRIPNGKRNALREFLSNQNVGTEIYYPVPLHQQECFASLGWEHGSLPETEKAVEEVLHLPIFPGITEQEQIYVVKNIMNFYRQEGLLDTTYANDRKVA